MSTPPRTLARALLMGPLAGEENDARGGKEKMTTNVKLVVGGIAGVLCAVGLAAGVIYGTSMGAEPRVPQAREPEPVESPNLAPELATTHQPSIQTPQVAPEPEVESYEPVLASGDVRVRRLIVATGIEGHEPTGASDVFELGAQRRLYAFVDAVNETDEPVQVRVTFEPERGESAGHVTLNVPASVSRYRTWAYTRHVYTEGRWHVVVRDTEGRVLARRPFDVER